MRKQAISVLEKLLCRLHGKHEMGAKFQRPVDHKQLGPLTMWYQSCVICDHTVPCEAPVKRKKTAASAAE